MTIIFAKAPHRAGRRITLGTTVSVDPSLQPFLDGSMDYGQLVLYAVVPPANTTLAFGGVGDDLGNGMVMPGAWTVVSYSLISIVISVLIDAAGTPLGARLSDVDDITRYDFTAGGPGSGKNIELASATVNEFDTVPVTITVHA